MDIMPSTNYTKLASSVSDSEQIRNDVAKVLLDAQGYIKENPDI